MLDKLINQLTEISVQSKIFHFQTGKYFTHKALDEFYSSFGEHYDSFVEQYIGMIQPSTNVTKNIVFEDVSVLNLTDSNDVDTIIDYFEDMHLFLSDMKKTIVNDYSSLENTYDDILSTVNTLLYQLLLK